MENVVDSSKMKQVDKAWDLEKIRARESDRYPDLSISMWHIKDVYNLSYMNEKRNCLSINLTPQLKFKDAYYKEDRYEDGKGQRAETARLPQDLKMVLDTYTRSYNMASQAREGEEYDR